MLLHTEILNRRWPEKDIIAANTLLSKLKPDDFHELAALMQRTRFLHDDYADQLRFAFEQKQLYGYQFFTKKSANGRKRILQSPPLALKHVQRHIHQWLSEVYTPHPAACGFVSNRGIKTHAKLHAGQPRVLCIDIKKCFSSTTYLHLMESIPAYIPEVTPQALRAMIYLCTNHIEPEITSPHTPIQLVQKAHGLSAALIAHIQQYSKSNWFRTLIEFAYDATDTGTLHLTFSRQEKLELLRHAQKMQTHSTLSLRRFFHVRLLLLIQQRIRQLKGLAVSPPPHTGTQAIQICEKILKKTAPMHQYESHNHRTPQLHLPFVLPQGAPSSPILSNICLHNLDDHLTQIAEIYGLNYSRYADDICFSGQHIPRRLTTWVAQLLEDEAFRINRSKVRHQGIGTQQRITGLIVNPEKGADPTRLDRKYIRKLRSVLHHLDAGRIAYGPLRPNGAVGPLSKAQVLGHLSFVRSISIQQYHRLIGSSAWAQANIWA